MPTIVYNLMKSFFVIQLQKSQFNVVILNKTTCQTEMCDCAVCFSGDAQKVEMPSKEMEVVRGQMVVLQAWYSPSSDISKNTVIWHFTGNESKQVRG